MNEEKILKISSKAKKIEKQIDNDERMRILANLIIDRILEDKKNGKLRFIE